MSVPLWNELAYGEQDQYVSEFVRLSPSSLKDLNPIELALLIQWTFKQHGIETISASLENFQLDLVLRNHNPIQYEFARLYFHPRGTPANALYDLLRTLEGESYKKIYFFTITSFAPAHKRIKEEYPMLFELKDGDQLEAYVQSAKGYGDSLQPRQAPSRPGTRKSVKQPGNRTNYPRIFDQFRLEFDRGLRAIEDELLKYVSTRRDARIVIILVVLLILAVCSFLWLLPFTIWRF